MDARFTLGTDNKVLTWLYKVQDERGKVTRWAMYLMRFNFDVEHVPGKDDELPDALPVFRGTRSSTRTSASTKRWSCRPAA